MLLLKCGMSLPSTLDKPPHCPFLQLVLKLIFTPWLSTPHETLLLLQCIIFFFFKYYLDFNCSLKKQQSLKWACLNSFWIVLFASNSVGTVFKSHWKFSVLSFNVLFLFFFKLGLEKCVHLSHLYNINLKRIIIHCNQQNPKNKGL